MGQCELKDCAHLRPFPFESQPVVEYPVSSKSPGGENLKVLPPKTNFKLMLAHGFQQCAYS